jgi:hypothetical protein
VFDPITTKAATSQQWFPEWVIAGTGGQDLDIVGRLNDPLQWQHAFGISSFAIGGDKPNPLDQLYEWYWGPDRGSRSVVSNALTVFFTGVHGAGPQLTPLTFRDALLCVPTHRRRRVGWAAEHPALLGHPWAVPVERLQPRRRLRRGLLGSASAREGLALVPSGDLRGRRRQVPLPQRRPSIRAQQLADR